MSKSCPIYCSIVISDAFLSRVAGLGLISWCFHPGNRAHDIRGAKSFAVNKFHYSFFPRVINQGKTWIGG